MSWRHWSSKLADLATMSPAQIRSLWRDTYRSPAPEIGPDLLRCGIANRLQERVHGGLTGTTKREIERLRKRVERTGKVGHVHAISLKTGTRLVRLGHGDCSPSAPMSPNWHMMAIPRDIEN
jgi:hypothetical protein